MGNYINKFVLCFSVILKNHQQNYLESLIKATRILEKKNQHFTIPVIRHIDCWAVEEMLRHCWDFANINIHFIYIKRFHFHRTCKLSKIEKWSIQGIVVVSKIYKMYLNDRACTIYLKLKTEKHWEKKVKSKSFCYWFTGLFGVWIWPLDNYGTYCNVHLSELYTFHIFFSILDVLLQCGVALKRDLRFWV